LGLESRGRNRLTPQVAKLRKRDIAGSAPRDSEVENSSGWCCEERGRETTEAPIEEEKVSVDSSRILGFREYNN
jgi:hypothetical protein